MHAREFRHVVVLTGAGISRSAGIPTFRGPGGLWTDPELAALSHVEALRTRREEVCAMYWQRRRAIRDVQPTAAHAALAAFAAARPPGTTVLVITQNVDGLHARASHRDALRPADVIEYHGALGRWRCERCGASGEPVDAPAPPLCCAEVMRPDIVMFGEAIPVAGEHAAARALRDCDLFVAIGTSGAVYPAASFVRSARYAGAKTVLLNLDAFEAAHDLFDEVRLGPSDELVPALFAPAAG